MTPEQRRALQAVTADTTTAQACVARALSVANSAGAHGGADITRRPLSVALEALREASEMLRQEAMSE